MIFDQSELARDQFWLTWSGKKSPEAEAAVATFQAVTLINSQRLR